MYTRVIIGLLGGLAGCQQVFSIPELSTEIELNVDAQASPDPRTPPTPPPIDPPTPPIDPPTPVDPPTPPVDPPTPPIDTRPERLATDFEAGLPVWLEPVVEGAASSPRMAPLVAQHVLATATQSGGGTSSVLLRANVLRPAVTLRFSSWVRYQGITEGEPSTVVAITGVGTTLRVDASGVVRAGSSQLGSLEDIRAGSRTLVVLFSSTAIEFQMGSKTVRYRPAATVDLAAIRVQFGCLATQRICLHDFDNVSLGPPL